MSGMPKLGGKLPQWLWLDEEWEEADPIRVGVGDLG